MSAEDNIALADIGHIFNVIEMTVGAEEHSVVCPHGHVVSHYGEFQHHLIYLCLTVASYAEQVLFHSVEHFYDFLGSIVLGKIVSGAVIEQVTQENELVRLFDFKALKQLSAAGGGAVEVTVSGKHEVTKVKLAEEVVDPDDIEMLEDLIVAATNEALRKVEEESAAVMSKLTGGLGSLGGGLPF